MAYTTENIRTVALLGHGSAGKTTLAEALLVATGAITAAGSVEKGTTVSDSDPLEKSFLHSLRTAVLHLDMSNTRVHVLDTPGFPDFIGQAIGALDAVETAAIVVNAQTGIEMITSRMMDWAARRKLCRLLVVNKIDADNVNLPQLLDDLRTVSARKSCRSTSRPPTARRSLTVSSIPPATRISRRSPPPIRRSSTRSSRSTKN
jgi:elongation factor G